MREKMAMVGWFDPGQLIQTAVRVAISTVFGQFADRREALASANPISDEALDPSFDFSKKASESGFWFDYVADTGDGWNPTFAIARLLAKDDLVLTGADAPLPRGRVLIMGGDQVYPTATEEDYENRLKYPFDQAHHPAGVTDPAWSEKNRPDLFAVPGNHDWYDGLRTFSHIFCRRTIKSPGEAEVDRKGSIVGGRATHQTRSYFALKLPNGWWLWGTDSQLAGYIDQPQVDFFQFVAQNWMEPESRLILCTGSPDWEYVRPNCPHNFEAHSYLERLAPAVRGKNHRLCLVLSGDSHHYARFQEEGLDYITCGGGGAFLHPTHHLPKEPIEFPSRYPRPGVTHDPAQSPYRRRFAIARKAEDGEEALYPSRTESSALTWGNAAFALRNWRLTSILAGLYLFFTWLLDYNARVAGHGSLVGRLLDVPLDQAVRAYWQLVFTSPSTVLLCLLAVAGYHYFADVARTWPRLALGLVHATLHAVVVTLITCVVVRAVAPAIEGDLLSSVLSLSGAAVASALASGTLIGLYLSVCLGLFGIHWGHFSSLAVQGYKSFLRLRIDGDGALHVHPVGLTRVPPSRGRNWFGRKHPPMPPLEPHLIERPIVIR